MAGELNLNLDPMQFVNMAPSRKAAFEASTDTPLPADYPSNRLMRGLHPDFQYLIIDEVQDLCEGAKSYTLVPCAQDGTDSLAYFNAGQYINVLLDIDGSKLYKPFSVCSSPDDALKKGRYVLTIKPSEDGFASTYILDAWKKGDRITTTGPEGTLTYEPLRDPKNVIGIAGGSGITPFYSLACAIAEGTEDFNLTVLYGSRKSDCILLKDEFDAIQAACDRVKVIHVLSEEENPDFEHGFITAELIKKYAPDGDFALFVCGPQAMYEYVDPEIEKLSLPRRRVRHELFGQINKPERFADYPQDCAEKVFTLNIQNRYEHIQVPCNASESLLVALERAGIAVPASCRSGECGFCHTKLASGQVYIPPEKDNRRGADVKYGYIHPCISFPVSDVSLVLSV